MNQAERLRERDAKARAATDLYFGCWQGAGHFFWLPGMERASGRPLSPWGWGVEKLAPRTMTQGLAALHHKDGWTALAVDDFTVDSRGNSKSVFLTKLPDLPFENALMQARLAFPEIIKRIGPIIATFTE